MAPLLPVEDNEMNRDMLSRRLGREGRTVELPRLPWSVELLLQS